ncbi:hypothetical protein GCM10022415_07300 [Knoellia locipacati]|uniref:Uncharacterized protein n=1 Tax=Knoellia locipacati TaxID=882824 RepID=A0A512SXK7_9MICO|nr:hypothetical protein KLO01_07280 [Knoellia locipacati]
MRQGTTKDATSHPSQNSILSQNYTTVTPVPPFTQVHHARVSTDAQTRHSRPDRNRTNAARDWALGMTID